MGVQMCIFTLSNNNFLLKVKLLVGVDQSTKSRSTAELVLGGCCAVRAESVTEARSRPRRWCAGEAWWGRRPRRPLPASALRVRGEAVPLGAPGGQRLLGRRVGRAREGSGAGGAEAGGEP